MPKILRRCSLCGNFHASFLVPELPAGKGSLCAKCWKAWMARETPSAAHRSGAGRPLEKADPPRTRGHNDEDTQH